MQESLKDFVEVMQDLKKSFVECENQRDNDIKNGADISGHNNFCYALAKKIFANFDDFLTAYKFEQVKPIV